MADPPYVTVETPRSVDEESHQTATLDIEQPANETARLVPLSQLFRFADRSDYALMAVGTVAALAAGVARPAQVLLLGSILNSFNPSEPSTAADLRSDVNRVALYFTLTGVGVMLCAFLQVSCWSLTASRQAQRIRSRYVAAIITKEMGWFDVNDPMQLAPRVAEATVAIQEGMGGKLGDALHFFSLAVAGLVIGLIKGWELALVMLACIPFIAGTSYVATKIITTATQSGIDAYAKAGAVAQESLANIRTVHMFNLIDVFVKKYATALETSTRAGIRKGLATGWGTGVMYFTVFCTFALGLFIGAVKIAGDQLDGNSCTGAGCYNGGRVVTVFFSVIMGAMGLGQAGPSIEAIVAARTAAFDIFQVIERNSKIDPTSGDGKQFGTLHGDIRIDNVSFAYPSRPDMPVCRNYSLDIRAGETVALVGPSGSGKSTIISLLERFYDPIEGSVQVDGHDIRSLNVKWLRQQIGLVGQEPTLFATSIMENIRHGRPNATDGEVLEAAKMANAFTFIMGFPQGFATEVGERGAQLSGGQKQRIAIARAIIKNPPILLLDEATSALDTESERVVQASLDALVAGSKRTTIIVAHRLSTIRDADRIAVHSDGAIVELGSHDELMEISDGRYRQLLKAQEAAATTSTGNVTKPPRDGHEDVRSQRLSTARSSRHSEKMNAEEASDQDTQDEEAESTTSSEIGRVWELSRPERKFLALGLAGGVINSAVFPVWGIILVKVVVLFFAYDKSRHDMLKETRYWSLGLVALGIVYAVSSTVQHYGFSTTVQRLIARVRLDTYSAMLRQEVGWFDLKEHSSGALVSRLATDAALLQAATAEALNQKVIKLTTLGLGFIIAFAYSWKMTLAIFATIPPLMIAMYIRFQQSNGTMSNKAINNADAAAGSLFAEAIGAIRTVASFSMEKKLCTQYEQLVTASNRHDTRSGLASGVAFGISQGLMFYVLAFLFWLGAKWVSNGSVSFESMFTVIMVVILATMAVGMASQGATSPEKGKQAARNIFKIIDRTPLIDANTDNGKRLETVQGQIDFHRLHFAYPSRPDATIYNNYSLHIQPGQTVALVGASGSGKSTAIALLERFYDPTSGSVSLDGHDIRDLNLPWLRERISLVSQEPVLFAGTIADNIAMGKPGATREEVIQAARSANAYDFIANFPDGFDTDVGDRGAQVSGGQKQRIAIARAILRDPDVLLLDEATSALDNESERVVQASLDALLAAKRRTTVVVAHRLSTIRNADVIAVTQDGAIVELGSHEQLMQRRDGIYYGMVSSFG